MTFISKVGFKVFLKNKNICLVAAIAIIGDGIPCEILLDLCLIITSR